MSTLTQTKTRSSGVADVVVHESYAPADLSAGGRGKGFPPLFKANPKAKQYTWQEVAQHNTGQNARKHAQSDGPAQRITRTQFGDAEKVEQRDRT